MRSPSTPRPLHLAIIHENFTLTQYLIQLIVGVHMNLDIANNMRQVSARDRGLVAAATDSHFDSPSLPLHTLTPPHPHTPHPHTHTDPSPLGGDHPSAPHGPGACGCWGLGQLPRPQGQHQPPPCCPEKRCEDTATSLPSNQPPA